MVSDSGNNGEYFVNIEEYFTNIHTNYMQNIKRHTVAICIANSDYVACSKLNMVGTFKVT